MRVLVYGMSGDIGGIETFLYNHIIRMSNKNLEFEFLCNAEKMAFEDELLEKGYKIWHLTGRSTNYIQFKKESKDFFEKNRGRYDVFWFNNCMLVNIEYLKLAKKVGIPKIILHSHNSNNMSAYSIKGYVMGAMHRINKRKACNIATDFWACSDYAAKWLFTKKYSSENAYEFIPNAISVDKFSYDLVKRESIRKEIGLENQFVIGYVGRFTYQKNTEFLIDIFNEVQKIKKDSKLVLIGEGPLEKNIDEKVENYNIKDKVIKLGVRDDVPDLLQAMDIFILASRFEGLPVVAVEAQAAGLECFVASNGISSQTKIIDDFYFMRLEDSAEKWAEKICNSNYVRKKMDEVIENAGFDIEQSALKIVNMLQ